MRHFHLLYAPDGEQGGAQVATPQPVANNDTPATNDTPAVDADSLLAELKKVRAEAAKYRVERNDLKAQVADLSPKAQRLTELEEAQKTEAEKLADKLAKLEADLTAERTRAERAIKTTAFLGLAAKAGVSADKAALLDLSKFDLGNEEQTIEQLKAFATPAIATAGKASAPAANGNSEASEKELIENYFRRAGRGVERIFGG